MVAQAAAGGALVEGAARRLLALEMAGATKTDNIAVVLRGLRTQAVRDVQARAFDPTAPEDERAAIGADPEGAVAERTVLGASRGGSGLLPSALRQVLLPDEFDEDVLIATAGLDRARVLRQVVPEAGPQFL